MGCCCWRLVGMADMARGIVVRRARRKESFIVFWCGEFVRVCNLWLSHGCLSMGLLEEGENLRSLNA